MVVPLKTVHKVKKHVGKFLRHQGDRFIRIGWKHKPTWRRPRGIDSRVRRRFKSNTRTVKIGFGTQASHRHILPCGFKKFTVHNVEDLKPLLIQNREYAAEIAHAVGAKKRIAIIEKAAEMNIKVLNAKARVGVKA